MGHYLVLQNRWLPECCFLFWNLWQKYCIYHAGSSYVLVDYEIWQSNGFRFGKRWKHPEFSISTGVLELLKMNVYGLDKWGKFTNREWLHQWLSIYRWLRMRSQWMLRVGWSWICGVGGFNFPWGNELHRFGNIRIWLFVRASFNKNQDNPSHQYCCL